LALHEGLTLNQATADFEIIARPNSSLTAKGRVYAVMIIAAFSLAVAIAFSLIGAWFVLPFAGLELVAVGYAFYYIHCHSQDYESIVIVGDQISVEKKSYKAVSKMVFNRYWAKVLLRITPSGDQMLLLRSHGKEIDFGRCYMTNDQRLDLAKQLKELVGVVS
jgi:uncharacterized membrane protein